MRFNCANLPGYVSKWWWHDRVATACWCSSLLVSLLLRGQFWPTLSTQRSVICTGRQSCLQPRAHESLCQGSGAPLCESRVTEIHAVVGSPGFMACTSHCPTVSCCSFISCGVFSTGTIMEMAGLMEKPQPHGRRQHTRQPSEGCNSTTHFLLLFFLAGMFSLPYPKCTCTQWSFTTWEIGLAWPLLA